MWRLWNIYVCHRCSAANSSTLRFPLETQQAEPPHSSSDCGANTLRFACSRADTHEAFRKQTVPRWFYIATFQTQSGHSDSVHFICACLRVVNATCVQLWGVANQCQLHAGWCQDSRLGKSRKRTSAMAEPDESRCIPRVTGPRGISCSQRMDVKRSSGQVGCFPHHPGPSASFNGTSWGGLKWGVWLNSSSVVCVATMPCNRCFRALLLTERGWGVQ